MTTPPFEEHGLWNYSGESGDWALSGVISLLLLWMNYAPSYGIPVGMPLALLTLTVALLIRRGWQRRPALGRAGLPEEQRRHPQKVAALGMAGIIVGVVIGVAVPCSPMRCSHWAWHSGYTLAVQKRLIVKTK